MKKLPLILFSLIFITSCSNQKTDWPEPTQTSKPWTRWWWMNNAVDKENLTRELTEFAEMGIGGVEITPIYGVKGEEHRTIEFLSEDFSEIIKFTIDEANRLGLGVDLPAGSGWRNGGPFVPREKGLWNLRIRKQELKKGQKINVSEDFENAACASFLSADGNKKEIVKGTTFQAETDGTVYVALRIKSNNDVKRPSVGGEGWAIDTFNEDITNWYLNEFWKRLGIDEGKLRCFFHDSFEYTGDFTTNFLEEFKKRRGYDLAPYLFVLAGDCTNADIVSRVKSDYRETLSDLVLESFIQPMTDWANKHQSLNRNQAHGSPGNILDLYAACDIPETEIFRYVEPGTVDVFVNKFASSAAHVTGQKLVSSESFTWLEEHWTVTTSDLVRATNRFFLAGVNHMFFHGTCYSPQDAEWPGWLFYASTQINNRNPLWKELPALFSYIEKTQSVLQKAVPRNDLLIYWPYYDVAASEGRLFNHLGVNKDAGWFMEHPIASLSEELADEGFTFDFISDKQLAGCNLIDGKIITSGESTYKAIVVPKTEFIPLATMKKLQEFIANGGTVIFDDLLPKSVPGMFEFEKRELQLQDMKAAISRKYVGNTISKLDEFGISGEKDLAQKGFKFIKMRMEDEDVFLVINTSLGMKDEWVNLSENARDFVLMNPMTGKISKAQKKENKLRIQLNVEESVFIRCSKNKANTKTLVYQESNATKKVVEGRWNIEFVEGGPVVPENVTMDKLQSWTQVGDTKTERFAGTAGYSIEFDWDGASAAFLDLGEVMDCARVYVNDKDYGSLLGPEYKVFIDNLLEGKNSLKVSVSNVAANRIRDMDKRGIVWRRFYDINFVNIEYEPFDASDWEVRDAGLIGPVRFYEIDKD